MAGPSCQNFSQLPPPPIYSQGGNSACHHLLCHWAGAMHAPLLPFQACCPIDTITHTLQLPVGLNTPASLVPKSTAPGHLTMGLGNVLLLFLNSWISLVSTSSKQVTECQQKRLPGKWGPRPLWSLFDNQGSEVLISEPRLFSVYSGPFPWALDLYGQC